MAASRMNNMWPASASTASANDTGVTTTTDILGMLQRGIISLPRAAELMHTTPSTISSYLEQVSTMVRQQQQQQLQNQDAASRLAATLSVNSPVTVTPVTAAGDDQQNQALDMSCRSSPDQTAVTVSIVNAPQPPAASWPHQPWNSSLVVDVAKL